MASRSIRIETLSSARTDDDLVALPGGPFRMGSDRHYPEEAPERRAMVDPFRIERTPVTNRAFAAFVAETGYVTVAERQPEAADYPDADPSLLKPGSSVFTPPRGEVDLAQPRQWWRFVVGADWRHPLGPGSSLEGLDDHPVVHVAYEDALAYARWRGRDLPTEAQWEYAAWGGVEGRDFPWGDELSPGGRRMANTWIGRFPHPPKGSTRRVRTTQVGVFPPNGFGLFDMIGNVWEWTHDLWSRPAAANPCCTPGARPALPRRVVKGGSHLCAPSYCRRYRPAARQPQEIDTATTHVGFRCVSST